MTKIDKKEHFTVPEGYFEHFAAQMMERLPEQEFQPVAVKRRSPWVVRSAASVACIVALGLSVFAYSYFDRQATQAAEAQMAESVQHYTVDEAADYAMLDRQDIYGMIVE